MNGISLYFQQPFHFGDGVSVPSMTSLTIQYNGQARGLTIGSNPGVNLPATVSNIQSTVVSLTYQNGQVTQLDGWVFAGGWFPLPCGSNLIRQNLNEHTGALGALAKTKNAFAGREQ